MEIDHNGSHRARTREHTHNRRQASTLEQDTPEWERYWSQLRRVYNRVKTADIAYEPSGTRSRFVGEIDPPFVTPDPDQVEVIAFITYGNEAWITNYVLMTKWAKTLPSDVTVYYLPKKSLWQNNPHPRAQPLRAVRQNPTTPRSQWAWRRRGHTTPWRFLSPETSGPSKTTSRRDATHAA